jgi:phosphatidylinositol glycan class V
LAYKEYCESSGTDQGRRPWCNYWIPSIYSWVQSHYWYVLPLLHRRFTEPFPRNVGFLRYWTLSNIPLFLIAAPMLWLLSSSSVTVLRDLTYQSTAESNTRQKSESATTTVNEPRLCAFPHLALPQLVLAVTAATNYHVQIINRISSGYPIWYLVVASWIVGREKTTGGGTKDKYSEWTIRLMVVYSIVQGILFAAFLPPA